MKQRRVRVDGFSDSDVNVKVAIVQLRTGQVFLAVDGVEPTLQNLVEIRQLMDAMVKELDNRFPRMVRNSVREMNNG